MFSFLFWRLKMHFPNAIYQIISYFNSNNTYPPLAPRHLQIRRIGKVIRRHMPFAIGIQVIAPPIHDQPTLLDELSLVDIGGTHAVSLAVAHLSLDGFGRPQA